MTSKEVDAVIDRWLSQHESLRLRVEAWLGGEPPDIDEPLSAEDIEKAGGRAVPMNRREWMAVHLWEDTQMTAILNAILSSDELTLLAEKGSDIDVAKQISLPGAPRQLFVTKLGLAALIGEDQTAAITIALKSVRDNANASPLNREKAETRLEMLAVGGPGIDLSSTMAQTAIGELVQAGVIPMETVALIQQSIFPVESPPFELVGATLLPFRTDGRVGDLP